MTTDRLLHNKTSYWIVAALVLAGIEIFLITFNLQSIKLLEYGLIKSWQLPFAYMDFAAKLGVGAIFLLLLFSRPRIQHYWQHLVRQFNGSRFAILMTVQFFSFIGLYLCTRWMYGNPEAGIPVSTGLSLAWLAFAIIALICWPLALAPWSSIKQGLIRERKPIVLAAVVSLVVWKLAKYGQSFWGQLAGEGLAQATFSVSAWLVSLISQQPVSANAADRTLGLGDFSVLIAPECSGYEGVGLITATIGLYLMVYRRDFRFPRVLLLFPLGAGIVWFLNCVRIAVLVLIGFYWSEGVAVGGFHSQAGWITFILTALVLLWMATNSSFFLRQQKEKKPSEPINLPVATLIPLVALLASTLLTSALVSDFNYWYPVRVFVVAFALYKVWPVLQWRPYRPGWEALAGAVVVAVLWVVFHTPDPESAAVFTDKLAAMPAGWAALWLLFRVLGSVVTVPLAEELAFRAYMLCKLSRIPVMIRGPQPFQVMAVAISSLAFGALHGSWFAGTLAGLVYALVRWRSQHIGDAVVAHGGTNALIFGYAWATDQWWLI